MTPQELLQRQRREQVDFNVSLPSITSREIQAGQYSVAVARTPAAEQTTLGRLADALGTINPIIAKYGEAQLLETERQILDVQQRYEGMSPEQRASLLEAPPAEQSLAKSFRLDYELNPVAAYRAKMLLGSSYNTEFNGMLSARIEEFKNKYINENGDKPSYSAISKELDDITKEYIESNAKLSQSDIMLSGFMQEAADTINRFKQTLPGAMAEQHKQEVLMPQLAESLARTGVQLDAGMEVDLVKLKAHWQNSSSSLSRDEQIKVIDNALALINFDKGTEQLEQGIEFLENMRAAGAMVGNTALDGGADLSESFYASKIDELDDMREAVANKEASQAKVRASQQKIKYVERFKTIAEDYEEDSSEAQDALEEELENIKKEYTDGNISALDRKELTTAVEQAFTEGYTKVTDTIDELTMEANRGPASISQLDTQLKSMLVNYIKFDLRDETYKGVDVSEALIGEFIRGDADDISLPSDGQFATFAVGPEIQRILSEKSQQFTDERYQAMELVARLEPGEEVTLGDKVYKIGERENVARKRNNIIAEYMTSRMNSIMKDAKGDVDSLLDSFVEEKKQTESTEAAEQKRLDDIAEQKGLKEKSKAMLSLKTYQLPQGRMGVKRGVATTLTGTGIERRTISAPFKNFFSAAGEKQTELNMPKLYASLEHTLQYNPYTPEETEVILNKVRAEYASALPVIKGNIFVARNAMTGGGASRGGASQAVRRAAADRYEKLTGEVLRARRLFEGYSADDIKQAISAGEGQKGYLKEGVALSDPKAFFIQELAGIDTPGPYQEAVPGDYKPKALLTDVTDEQLSEISEMLGLDVEKIKTSQKALEDSKMNRKPAKEPEVIPTVPEEEPEPAPEPAPVPVSAPEPVAPAQRERPEIPAATSLEDYGRRRATRGVEGSGGTRGEQLELPLGDSKAALGSVDRSTIELVKRFEGEFQSKAFWDNKQYSIGFGTKARRGQTMTIDQAERELAKELAGHAKKVDSYDKVYNWTPNERAALISFTFNLGDGGLDTLTDKGKRTKQEIAEKILLYNKETVKGKKRFSKGLYNRRKAEREKFLGK
jgi:GH24 family phage-related lysozyme (muramidase)